VADAGGTLCFARTRDGKSWEGNDDDGPGALLPGFCLNPQVLVDKSGGVHMVWMSGAHDRRILLLHSADGGATFGSPLTVASGIVDVCEWLPETVPATCITPGGVVMCAWPDFRDGYARIYRRRSIDNGRTWLGPAAGEPLEVEAAPEQHQFQPHLLVTPAGEICCAFYEYGPKVAGGAPLVTLVMVVSYDGGVTFTGRMELSEQPWNPAADEPLSRSATKGALDWLSLG